MIDPIVIIGTGLAGYTLAREFRKHDSHSPLLIITQDDGYYYSKPQLSSAHTHGKTAAMLAMQTPEKLAEQLQCQILTHTTVTAIIPQQNQVLLGEKAQSYTKLILALGADPIPLSISGNAAQALQTVNNLMDYRRFRDSIQDKQHIAIIGAGLIGCEFANDLSNGGYQVAVIAPSSSPLERLLPASVGGSLQEALAKQGIAWYLNRSVVSLNQAESNYQLILSDGQVLTADAVLSAIGLRPHTALAKAAGIAIKQGISVNQFLQTNIANIYALGDCAEVASHALQYVAPIVLCARALAQTLAGIPTPIHYPAMPIIIKTPAYPIVVCPPVLNNSDGTWQIEQHQTGMRALFHDLQGKLQGFVLTGSLTNDRMALTQQLPDWLAAFKQ